MSCSHGTVQEMTSASREELHASVYNAILELPEAPKLEAVRRHLYPYDGLLDSATESALRASHSSILRVLLLAHIKEAMATDPGAFTAANYFAYFDADPVASRHLLALDPKEAENLRNELASFHRKLTRGAHQDLSFEEALEEWIKSGEPTTEMWAALSAWRVTMEAEGGGLDYFWGRVQPILVVNGAHGGLRKVMETAHKYGAAEFHDRRKIFRILRRCSPTFISTDARHVRIKGDVLVGSLIIEGIRERIKAESPHTVSIYASQCCALDISLDGPEWCGVNLCIVTRRLFVHEDISINLSGRAFGAWPGLVCPQETGAAGACGRAGGSSGNLCILAEELIGVDRLTVTLNGGRGQDGQQGARGERGDPGVGVTEAEIRRMDFPGDVRSLDEFRCMKRQVFNNLLCERAKYYKFLDKKDRWVTYSMYGDRSPIKLTFVQGSLGMEGRYGGIGGAGGEGGRRGDCHISDFEFNRPSATGVVRANWGDPGNDGAHGERGPPGEDGNDMFYWREEGRREELRSSTAGKKLRKTYTEAHLPPPNGLLLPHTVQAWNNIWPIWLRTFISFEECEVKRIASALPDRPHPDRTPAVAQATLQASTAMNEFALMCGDKLSGQMSNRSEQDDGGTRRAPNQEVLLMVQERSPGAEEIDEEGEDPDEHLVGRPSLLPCDRGVWKKSMSKIRILAENRCKTFDVQFDGAQDDAVKQGADLIARVDEFTRSQPSITACNEFIKTFGVDSQLPSRVLLTQSVLTSSDAKSFNRLLSALIAADGDSLCWIKWRTIVDTIYGLSTGSPRCEWKLIALLMAFTPMDDLMNTLIHLRLVIAIRQLDLLIPSRGYLTPKLWDPLQAIRSTEARALLLIKLEEVGKDGVTVDDVHNVLVLLRHSKRQLQQLSILTFRQWVDIARRQKRNDKEKYGGAAYYLNVLARAGFMEAERDMRKVLIKWKLTPQLFGLFVQYIVSGEIVPDAVFNEKLEMAGGRDSPELSPELRALLPFSGQRSIHEVAQLAKALGYMDIKKRKEWQCRSQQIVEDITSLPPMSEHATLLATFDDALDKTMSKRLRPVQKYVLMESLESRRHLLQQVATGEGKTIIIAAIAAIRCMKDKKTTVDVISSSSVLAKRDATQLQQLFTELGLSVAHNCAESRDTREIAYKARIVYGDMAHFQRDYLLHTFYRKNIRGSRQLDCVIVDEVDSMTLDGGNHVLYLSHKLPSLKMLDSLFAFIQQEVYSINDEVPDTNDMRDRVLRDIYGRLSKEELKIIDGEHGEQVFGTLKEAGIIDEEGFILVKEIDNVHQLLQSVGDPLTNQVIVDALRMEMERLQEICLPFHLRDFVRLHISTFIENCKRARVMRPKVDYVVDLDRSEVAPSEATLTIIDGDTGADLSTTQWAGGLHQFLQMKHACRVEPMSLKAVFISNITFLKKYERLDGLSGTLGSAEESRTLADIYDVDLICVPTHEPRNMVEYVPLLPETEDDWTKQVYDGVRSEVEKMRSVLLICETIDQLEQLHEGLKTLNKKRAEEGNVSEPMNAALDGIVVYARQHDDLNCQVRGLETGKLVLSTNLAGRGTDILLSAALAREGGLHVIIGFVPRNKRIEEQAMGRAARCGAKGSGQIIALVRPIVGEVTPSVLDFQERRDQTEKVRINALRLHFEFRIAVEEGALERFRYAIDDKLFREESNVDRLPEAEEVIYRALLDEWILWLDAKDVEIKQCADRKDSSMKESIIASVDEFLASHRVFKIPNPKHASVLQEVDAFISSLRDENANDACSNKEYVIDSIESFIITLRANNITHRGSTLDSIITTANTYLSKLRSSGSDSKLENIIGELDKCFSPFLVGKMNKEILMVPKWIRAGEWLLRLGIIQAAHKRGRADAERTFQRVIDAGDAQAPYAFFYLACMSMTRFEKIRDRRATLLLASESKFTSDVDKAIMLFARARVAFLEQLTKRTTEVRAIQKRAEAASCTDCGLQLQLREFEAAVKQIIANIDWLIGEPMSPSAFRPLVVDDRHQRQLFDSLRSIDAISPAAIEIDPRMSAACHHRIIRRKFGLSKAQMLRALDFEERMGKHDDDIEDISEEKKMEPVTRKKYVMPHGGGWDLTKRCTLPTRLDFWQDMHALGVFVDGQHVYVIDEDSLKEVTASIGNRYLTVGKEQARAGILYSNRELKGVLYYPKNQVDELIASDKSRVKTIRRLLDSDSLRLDMLARIDASKLRDSHLLQFDGFTPAQLKRHFDFSDATCSWVLNRLSGHGVIELHRVSTVQLCSEWRNRLQLFEWRNPTGVVIDSCSLEGLNALENAFAISPEILAHVLDVFKSIGDSEKKQLVHALFHAFIEQGLLERRDVSIYRHGCHPVHLDCSMLPRSLAKPLMEFLQHHFAYSFARDVLSSACLDSQELPYTIKEVLLPADAHQELFDEFCRLNIISPPRIISDAYDLIDHSDFPFVPERELDLFIHSRRQKLRDSIQMFELVPFARVLMETGGASTSEMEALIDLGMVAGVSLRKVSTTQKIAGALFGFGTLLMNSGLLLIKGIARVLGTVIGAAAYSAGRVLSRAFDGLGRLVSKPHKRTLYKAAIVSLDAFEFISRKIELLIEMSIGKIVGKLTAFIGKASRISLVESVVRNVHRCLSYMYERCHALFGSSEYYKQCRLATHSMAQSLPHEAIDEYRLIRLFNNFGAAAEQQNAKVNHHEQELVNQLLDLSRKLKAEMFTRLTPQPSLLSFPGLIAHANSLENKRWFESELKLHIRLLAIEARRELFQNRQLNEAIGCSGMTHVTVAYSAMWREIYEEERQRKTAETEDGKEDESLENFVLDLIDVKMNDLFINPLVNFIRCTMSECFASEPHRSFGEGATEAARHLSKSKSKEWLLFLQETDISSRIHARIDRLFNDLTVEKFGNEERANSFINLTLSTLHHRQKVPFTSCLSLLCIFLFVFVCITTMRSTSKWILKMIRRSQKLLRTRKVAEIASNNALHFDMD